MKKRIYFLKPGKFTDNNGKQVEITPATLSEIIEATKKFEYQNDEFPLVIGHPKTDTPAFGQVNKNQIILDGEFLAAEVEDEKIHSSLKDWVKQKLYNTVSVALRKDKSIKHIGFLGAAPPAVTGLPAIAFTEEEGDINISFSQSDTIGTESQSDDYLQPYYFQNLATAFRNIKNYLIEQETLDIAEQILPEYLINSFSTPPAIIEVDEADEDDTVVPDNTSAFSETDKKTMDDLKKKNEQLAAENSKLKADSRLLTAKKLRDAAVQFCESNEVKNKIRDGEKESVIQTIILLENMTDTEFSESAKDGKGQSDKKLSPVEMFKNFIKSRADVIEFGEHITKDNAAADYKDIDVSEFAQMNVNQDRLDLHRKALLIQKKNNIPYEEALRKSLTSF